MSFNYHNDVLYHVNGLEFVGSHLSSVTFWLRWFLLMFSAMADSFACVAESCMCMPHIRDIQYSDDL